MIIGIGTDILQISRIKIKHAKRILSESEFNVFDSFENEKRRLEYLAGRFCLKEAIIKAVGSTEHRIGMRDITILNDEKGKPYFEKELFENYKIYITLSHEIDYCVGFCIIENV